MSSLGLLISSFYKNLVQTFGTLFLIVILMIIPNIDYFIPGWSPTWVKFIPTHNLIYSFKELITVGTDYSYAIITLIYFSVGGLILFIISNYRFKKTLTI